jgi:hypothetical protein
MAGPEHKKSPYIVPLECWFLSASFLMPHSLPINIDSIQDQWHHQTWINAGKTYPASDVPLFVQKAQAEVITYLNIHRVCIPHPQQAAIYHRLFKNKSPIPALSTDLANWQQLIQPGHAQSHILYLIIVYLCLLFRL